MSHKTSKELRLVETMGGGDTPRWTRTLAVHALSAGELDHFRQMAERDGYGANVLGWLVMEGLVEYSFPEEPPKEPPDD